MPFPHVLQIHFISFPFHSFSFHSKRSHFNVHFQTSGPPMSSALLSSLSTQSQSPIPNATSFNHSSTIPLFAAHPVHPVPLQVVSAYLCKCELPSTVLLLLLVMSHCNEVDWSAATQRHSSQSKNNNLTAQAVCVPVPSEVDKQQIRK